MGEREVKELKLVSPVRGADPIIYTWPLKKSKEYDAAQEIIDTIRWVCQGEPELNVVVSKALKDVVPSNYESMKALCDKYNKAVTAIKQLWEGATKPSSHPRSTEQSAENLLRNIIQQCYNRSVTNPEKLNQYQPFSPQVYGETSFELVAKMLEVIKPTDEDIFIDLGSGVGQVVMQVAASSKVKKCYGIEKADCPNEYARNMTVEFMKWMRWYGRKWRPFELIEGDFLHDKHRGIITSSTIIFVNNYAFGPSVDHKLKEIFADLSENVRIVSSKSFCATGSSRITERDMSDIGCMMNVSELSPRQGAGSVSWTDKPVSYYLHTIDRTKLHDYFDKLKNPPPKEDSKKSRSTGASSESHSSSRESSIVNAQNDKPYQFDEGALYGPTTRRQWNNWVQQQERIKSEIERQRQGATAPTGGIMRRKTSAENAASQAKKKYSKQQQQKSRQGRQQVQPSTLSGLDMLHDEILRKAALSHHEPPGAGCNPVTMSSLRSPRKLKCELNDYLEWVRGTFESFFVQAQKPEYRQFLIQEIEKEKDRKRELQKRLTAVESQVSALQQEGVQLLKHRMAQLNIEAENPQDLLNKAKQIVISHKDLQSRSSVLQAEVNTLEQQNKQLMLLTRERDDQALRTGMLSGIGADYRTVQEAKEGILKEISQNFQRRRQLMESKALLEDDIYKLEQNISMSAAVSVQPSPVGNSSGASGTNAQRSVGTTARGRSPKKSKPAGAVNVSNSSGLTLQPSGSESQEDIERKIQDIVRKALSVDSAAKSAAEATRRGRGGGQRRRERPGRPGAKIRNTSSSASVASTVLAVASGESLSGVQQQRDKLIEQQSVGAIFAGAGLIPVPVPMEEKDTSTDASVAQPVSALENNDALLSRGFESTERRVLLELRPSSVPVGERQSDFFRVENLIAPRESRSTESSGVKKRHLGKSGTSGSGTTMRLFEAAGSPKTVEDECSSSSSTATAASAQDVPLDMDGGAEGGASVHSGHVSPAQEAMNVDIGAARDNADAASDNNSRGSGHSSNTGHSGNPHAQSNPGNPTKEQSDDVSRTTGTSNTGHSGNPHDYSNPGNPQAAEKTDGKRKVSGTVSSKGCEAALSQSLADLFPKTTQVKSSKLESFRIPRSKKQSLADSPAGVGSDRECGFAAMSTVDTVSPLTACPAETTKPLVGTYMTWSNSGAKDKGKAPVRRNKASMPPSSLVIKSLTRENLEEHSTMPNERADVVFYGEADSLMDMLLKQKIQKGGRMEPPLFSQEADRILDAAPGPRTPPGTPPSSSLSHKNASNPSLTDADISAHQGSYQAPLNVYDGTTGYSEQPSTADDGSGLYYHWQDCDNNAVATAVSTEREVRERPVNAEQRSGSALLESLGKIANMDPGVLAGLIPSETLNSLQALDPSVLVVTVTALLGGLARALGKGDNGDAGGSAAAGVSQLMAGSSSSGGVAVAPCLPDCKVEEVQMELDSSSSSRTSPSSTASSDTRSSSTTYRRHRDDKRHRASDTVGLHSSPHGASGPTDAQLLLTPQTVDTTTTSAFLSTPNSLALLSSAVPPPPPPPVLTSPSSVQESAHGPPPYLAAAFDLSVPPPLLLSGSNIAQLAPQVAQTVLAPPLPSPLPLPPLPGEHMLHNAPTLPALGAQIEPAVAVLGATSSSLNSNVNAAVQQLATLLAVAGDAEKQQQILSLLASATIPTNHLPAAGQFSAPPQLTALPASLGPPPPQLTALPANLGPPPPPYYSQFSGPPPVLQRFPGPPPPAFQHYPARGVPPRPPLGGFPGHRRRIMDDDDGGPVFKQARNWHPESNRESDHQRGYFSKGKSGYAVRK